MSELSNYLEANNGIKGLEILDPDEVEQAVALFRRDGFVVVADVLNDEQIEILASGCKEVVDEIVAQGKITYVGSSNFPGCAIARANKRARARHQLGLISDERRAELEVIPACREYGLGSIPCCTYQASVSANKRSNNWTTYVPPVAKHRKPMPGS